jgi:hypothetical protein
MKAVRQCKSLILKKSELLIPKILAEEERLAFSDVRNLFRSHNGGWELVPPNELPDDIARSISSIRVVQRIIPRGDREPVVEYTYRYDFWDKGRALERLSKHLGLYKEDNDQKKLPPQINMFLEQGNVQMAMVGPKLVGEIGLANGYDNNGDPI